MDSDQSDDMQEDPVSKQIMEYYNKYSQSKQLPKYFSGASSSVSYLPEIVVSEPQVEEIERTSPNSSITSIRPLEWDNGADIGYDCDNYKNKSLEKSTSLPELEHIDTVYKTVIAPSSVSSNGEGDKCKGSTTSSSKALRSSSENNLTIKTTTEPSSSKSSALSFLAYVKSQIGSPDAESTPRLPVQSSQVKAKKVVQLVVTRPIVLECVNDNCATNTRGIQTGPSLNSDHESLGVNQSVVVIEDNYDGKSSANTNGIASSGSFEYFTPNRIPKVNKSSSSSESPILAQLINQKQSQNLVTDIDKSLDILQKLLRSKKYDPVTKKRYIKRIVRKILDNNYDSTSESSSSSSKLFQPKPTPYSQKLEENKPWYPPFETNTFSDQYLPEGLVIEPRKKSIFTSPHEPISSTNEIELKAGGDHLVKFAMKERRNQISWINSEISHLTNLKHLLERRTSECAVQRTTTVYMVSQDPSPSNTETPISSESSNSRNYVIETELDKSGSTYSQNVINFNLYDTSSSGSKSNKKKFEVTQNRCSGGTSTSGDIEVNSGEGTTQIKVKPRRPCTCSLRPKEPILSGGGTYQSPPICGKRRLICTKEFSFDVPFQAERQLLSKKVDEIVSKFNERQKRCSGGVQCVPECTCKDTQTQPKLHVCHDGIQCDFKCECKTKNYKTRGTAYIKTDSLENESQTPVVTHRTSTSQTRPKKQKDDQSQTEILSQLSEAIQCLCVDKKDNKNKKLQVKCACCNAIMQTFASQTNDQLSQTERKELNAKIQTFIERYSRAVESMPPNEEKCPCFDIMLQTLPSDTRDQFMQTLQKAFQDGHLQTDSKEARESDIQTDGSTVRDDQNQTETSGVHRGSQVSKHSERRGEVEDEPKSQVDADSARKKSVDKDTDIDDRIETGSKSSRGTFSQVADDREPSGTGQKQGGSTRPSVKSIQSVSRKRSVDKESVEERGSQRYRDGKEVRASQSFTPSSIHEDRGRSGSKGSRIKDAEEPFENVDSERDTPSPDAKSLPGSIVEVKSSRVTSKGKSSSDADLVAEKKSEDDAQSRGGISLKSQHSRKEDDQRDDLSKAGVSSRREDDAQSKGSISLKSQRSRKEDDQRDDLSKAGVSSRREDDAQSKGGISSKQRSRKEDDEDAQSKGGVGSRREDDAQSKGGISLKSQRSRKEDEDTQGKGGVGSKRDDDAQSKGGVSLKSQRSRKEDDQRDDLSKAGVSSRREDDAQSKGGISSKQRSRKEDDEDAQSKGGVGSRREDDAQSKGGVSLKSQRSRKEDEDNQSKGGVGSKREDDAQSKGGVSLKSQRSRKGDDQRDDLSKGGVSSRREDDAQSKGGIGGYSQIRPNAVEDQGKPRDVEQSRRSQREDDDNQSKGGISSKPQRSRIEDEDAQSKGGVGSRREDDGQSKGGISSRSQRSRKEDEDAQSKGGVGSRREDDGQSKGGISSKSQRSRIEDEDTQSKGGLVSRREDDAQNKGGISGYSQIRPNAVEDQRKPPRDVEQSHRYQREDDDNQSKGGISSKSQRSRKEDEDAQSKGGVSSRREDDAQSKGGISLKSQRSRKEDEDAQGKGGVGSRREDDAQSKGGVSTKSQRSRIEDDQRDDLSKGGISTKSQRSRKQDDDNQSKGGISSKSQRSRIESDAQSKGGISGFSQIRPIAVEDERKPTRDVDSAMGEVKRKGSGSIKETIQSGADTNRKPSLISQRSQKDRETSFVGKPAGYMDSISQQGRSDDENTSTGESSKHSGSGKESGYGEAPRDVGEPLAELVSDIIAQATTTSDQLTTSPEDEEEDDHRYVEESGKLDKNLTPVQEVTESDLASSREEDNFSLPQFDEVRTRTLDSQVEYREYKKSASDLYQGLSVEQGAFRKKFESAVSQTTSAVGGRTGSRQSLQVEGRKGSRQKDASETTDDEAVSPKRSSGTDIKPPSHGKKTGSRGSVKAPSTGSLEHPPSVHSEARSTKRFSYTPLPGDLTTTPSPPSTSESRSPEEEPRQSRPESRRSSTRTSTDAQRKKEETGWRRHCPPDCPGTPCNQKPGPDVKRKHSGGSGVERRQFTDKGSQIKITGGRDDRESQAGTSADKQSVATQDKVERREIESQTLIQETIDDDRNKITQTTIDANYFSYQQSPQIFEGGESPSPLSMTLESGATSPPSTSPSTDNSLRLCSCCKRQNVTAQILEKIRRRLSDETFQPLCRPCFQTRCTNTRTCHGYNYDSPKHICNCYTVVETQTIQAIKNTIKDLNSLDNQHCSCVDVRNKKTKTYCGCKLRRTSKNSNGLAYMLTFENGTPDDSLEQTARKKELEEIRIKVPGPHKKKLKDKQNTRQKRRDQDEEQQQREEGDGQGLNLDGGEGEASKGNESNSRKDHYKTVREYLDINRPEFVAAAENRRRAVSETRQHRQDTADCYRLQFLDRQNTCAQQDCRGIRRIFTDKEMKEINRRNYRCLPEVQKQLEDDRRSQIREANRLIADQFNKRLRDNVLKGKLSLPTDVNVINS